MIINNKFFNILKWMTIIGLPPIATAVFAIGQIWELDNTGKVVGTIVALNTLLGAWVGVSAATYNASDAKYDGTISPRLANMQTSDEALNLGPMPKVLDGQKEVLLKVDTSGSPEIVEH